MKIKVLFIGNKFVYNETLREYALRKIREHVDFISSITYFKENDNSLFLYLENELNTQTHLIIITTKQTFTTTGKLICTVTSDNQVLKDNMLIPQKASLYEEGSYLLSYKESQANVLYLDEMQKMPPFLLESMVSKALVHVFEEEQENCYALLNPLAQTNDVTIEIVTLIDGWLRIDISSNKYGNISNFITTAKKLLSNKLIAASNIVLYIIDVLQKNNKKITFAESCTGGLLSYYFTKENGASKILDGALVTYSNELKENWIAVENKLLERYGAVSSEVVESMSDGALSVSDADYSIAISGIAGDTGGSEFKPVGTIYIGVRSKDNHKEHHLFLNGDRNYIQHQSALHGIKSLILLDKELFF